MTSSQPGQDPSAQQWAQDKQRQLDADGSLPEEFTEVFCTALVRHRAWEHDTAAVPA